MSSNNTVVYGIYPNRIAVETAVNTLRESKFRKTDVSVLFSDSAGSKDFAHEKGTKAPEGTAIGASTGVVVGGALGWLAGIGALSIPAVGPLIAAGPIVALLAGAGVGGTLGGLTGGIIGLGIPEYEAKRFEGLIMSGGILLSVHCDSSEWALKAKRILADTGAKHIAATSEAKADIKFDEHNQIVRESA
jgi:hypothetical protein